MAAKSELALVVKAVDEASGPLKLINAKIAMLKVPEKLRAGRIELLGMQSGLPKLMNGFQGFGSAVSKVGSEAFSLGTKLAAMAAGASVAFFAVVKGAVEAGDKLGEMADRVGVTVDFYASLGFAAQQADVDQDQFNGAMDKFNKNMGEMTAGKGGEFLHFLNEISPALAKQMKSAKGTEDAFALMTDAFAKIDNPAKRAALAAHAFGKSGLVMGNFLHQGNKALTDQRAEFFRLAGSQEEFARTSGDLDNAMKKTETAFLGLRSAAASALFPALTMLSEGVTEFLISNREGISKWAKESGAAITEWVRGGGIDRLVTGIKSIVETIEWAVGKIGGFKGVLVAVGAFMAGPLIAAIAGVIPAIYSLGAALLTTPVGWVLLSVAAIAGAVWLIYDNWEGISAFFENQFGNIIKTFQGLKEMAMGFLTFDVERVLGGWTKAVEGFQSSLRSALALMTVLPGGQLAAKVLFGTGIADKLLGESGPPLGADAARPNASAPLQSEAKISVDFANMPPGARVSTASTNTQSIDISRGFSMVAP